MTVFSDNSCMRHFCKNSILYLIEIRKWCMHNKQEVKKQWKKCNLPWTNRFQFVHQQHWYVREWCMHNKQKVKKQWNPTILFFFSSISAMSLPQTHCNKFFSLLFRQCHCHKSIATFFFLEMICTHHFCNIFTINSKW